MNHRLSHDSKVRGGFAVLLGAGWALRERHLAAWRRATEAELARSRAVSSESEELHRISLLVASGASSDVVCATVARTATELFDAHLGLVAQLDENNCGKLRGLARSRALASYPSTGDDTRFAPQSAVGRALAQRRTVRVPEGTRSSHAHSLGERVATPITLADGVWGAIALAAAPGATLVRDVEGPLERFAALVALAIGNAEARAQLIAQASTDSLTGLANRRRFHERLEHEIVRAHRNGRQLSLAIVDVDRFKVVNDTLGHLAGDAVLTDVAQRLRAATRAEATIARIGGDEFAVILPETNLGQAHELAHRACALIRDTPVLDDLRVTVSIGVAALGPETTSEQLRHDADRALYAAKQSGRDDVRQVARH